MVAFRFFVDLNFKFTRYNIAFYGDVIWDNYIFSNLFSLCCLSWKSRWSCWL